MITEPRPYQSPDDIDRMREILIAGRQTPSSTFYVHIGDLNWWLYYISASADRRALIYLWEVPDTGTVLGWSLLSPAFRAFDVFMHPRILYTPQAAQLWTWTEERMAAIAREHGQTSMRTMWVGDTDAWLIAHLEGRGFTRNAYHLVHITRSLDVPIPAAPLPPGYVVRTLAGEQEAVARALAGHAAFESRRDPYEYVRSYLQFMRTPVYDPALDVVVVAPDERVASFVLVWLDPVNRVGLLEPAGTHPEFQRRGLARAVLLEGLRRMQARGMTTAVVYPEANSPAALGLHQAIGAQPVGTIHTYVKSFTES